MHRRLFFLAEPRIVAPSSGRGHDTVVDTVRPVGRLKPGVAAQVVGRALDFGRDAAGRQRRIDPAHRVRGARRAAGGAAGVVRRGIGAAGGDAGVVGGGRVAGAGGVARRVGPGGGGARGDTGVVGARGGRGGGGGARGDARAVGARRGRGGIGRGDARAGRHAEHGSRGGRARGGPAAAVAAAGSVVVH